MPSAATIQIELSRPAYPIDRTIFGPGTVLASFGEQSRTTFKHASGRLSIILTPPDGFVGMEPQQVFDAVMHDAAKIGFDLRPLVTDYRVINEPNQFYALSPGQNPLRPDQATPVPGLTLAGGYTKQPWVDTMEGATVSGHKAADVLLREAKDPKAKDGHDKMPAHLLAASAARGAVAGLAGTAVMTAFQRAVEMPLTGRAGSEEPLRVVKQLTPFSPPRNPRRRRAVNYVVHFGIGAAWGAAHGLLASRWNSRGFASGVKVFAVLWPGDAVGNAALGVHDWPWRWSPRDAAVDVADKFVLAAATAVAFDRLRTGASWGR